MTTNFIIGLGEQSMFYVLKMVGPILIISLASGLIISLFQATTQIQEQTLTFIPKIVAVIVALLIFGPWMLTNSVDFTKTILENLMAYVS